ncbi:PQQ-like beta-propeller repeat protein [Ferruginivarius sediminum]|uniref:Pyrrolo-quinoline quinone n=1 Tax=Ferruginivarius sediminum TaxID=2661937 RepID=A0A369TB34_9PROT|nr:PQQ-like beta-propeller repeat protein [Ferruginivarius sediminum]RDD62490.1 pyrrolo-quinoline quinone [Ferruginivarius sediminum]
MGLLGRALGCAALALLVGGCGVTEWFEDEEERLPGERISVLTLEQQIEADPEVAEQRVALPKPYRNESWGQPGGAPSHAMYHLSLPENPREAWRADVGESSGDDQQILAQPIVVSGRVYTMDATATVSAFSAEDGERLWRRDVSPEDDEGVFGGGLAYDQGRLFVTTGYGTVVALDPSNGEEIWRQRVGAPMRAGPAARDGRVFAVTVINQTVALSADDGRELWRHQGIEEQSGLLGSATPAATDSAVIVAYSSGEILALLNDNGRVLWNDSLAGITRTDPVADMADIRGMPVVDRGLVYAASNSGRMAAIDLRRGARAWEAEIGSVEMPWAGGAYVFAVTTDAQLVALTRERGRVRWVTQLPAYEDPEDKTGPIVWQGPVLAGDRLILAGSNETAVTVSPYNGEVLGTIGLPDKPAVSPVVAKDTVYILTDDATLLALR